MFHVILVQGQVLKLKENVGFKYRLKVKAFFKAMLLSPTLGESL